MGYTWQEARNAWARQALTIGDADTLKVLNSYFQMQEAQDVPVPRRIDFSPSCPTRQEQDEYVCAKCLLRWDITEDKPPCGLSRW